MKKSIFTYCIIWVAVIAWFWIMYNNINPIDYSIFVFYLILPLATIICSAKAVVSGCSFKGVIFGLLFMGFAYSAAYHFTFNLANMIAFDKINPFIISFVFVGALIALIGFIIGWIIRLFRVR